MRFRDLATQVVELLRKVLPARSTEGSPTPGSAAACLEGLLSQLGSLHTGVGHVREINRSTVTVPGSRTTRAATAVSDADLGSLTALHSIDAISTVPTLARIRTGSFHINRVTILVNVRSDSLCNVIARINESPARVTASYDATTSLVSITATSNTETLVLSDGTSGFFSAVNILPGTFTPAEISAPVQRTLADPSAFVDQLVAFGKALDEVFSGTFDGLDEELHSAIQETLVAAISKSSSEITGQTDPSTLDSGFGIRFDFRDVARGVFVLDRRRLAHSLTEDFDSLADFLFREASSGEKGGLVVSLIEAVKDLERMLEDVLAASSRQGGGMSMDVRA